MEINISMTNSKLGSQIPSVSLPPQMSCREDAPGARLCYYNMMVPRDLAALDPDSFVPLRDEADALFARNRAFFYGAFHVDCKSSPA